MSDISLGGIRRQRRGCRPRRRIRHPSETSHSNIDDLTDKSPQGLGGMLIRKVDGDFWNVVGFPAASFFKFLDMLVDEEDDFLEI